MQRTQNKFHLILHTTTIVLKKPNPYSEPQMKDIQFLQITV